MSEDTKPHLCTECHAAFSQRDELIDHLTTHHSEVNLHLHDMNEFILQPHEEPLNVIDIRPRDDVEDSDEEETEEPFKYVECDVCKQIHVFQTEEELRHHVSIYKGFRCNTCGNTTATTHNTDDPSQYKPYQCNTCGKTFSRKRDLTVHEETHTGVYKCITCGKVFPLKSSLTNHEKSHTGDKNIKCPICGETFGSSLLKYHMKIHNENVESDIDDVFPVKKETFEPQCSVVLPQTSEMPFKCAICRKEFPLQSSLTNHQKSHTGDKKIKCTVCGKKFERGLLMYHMKIHAEDPPKNDTLQSDSLLNFDNTVPIVHYAMSEPKDEMQCKCGTCGKEFSLQSSLTNHEKAHTFRRRIKCAICGEKFDNDLFVYHMKMHTEDTDTEESIHSQKVEQISCVVIKSEKDDNTMAFENESLQSETEKQSNRIGTVVVKTEIHNQNDIAQNIEAEKQRFENKNSELSYEVQGQVTETSHKCRACGQTFEQKACLTNHMKTHELYGNVSGRRIRCEICKKLFGGDLFQYHIKLHEGKQNHSIQNKYQTAPEIGNKIMTNDRTLNMSNKKAQAYPSKEILPDREVTHRERTTCKVCGKTFGSNLLQYHMKIHDEDRRLCNAEDEKTDVAKGKKDGSMENNNKGRTTCKVCGKTFGSNLLQYHMKIHDEDRRLCNVEDEGTDVTEDQKGDTVRKGNKLAAKTENLGLENFSVGVKFDEYTSGVEVSYDKELPAGENKIVKNDRKLRMNSKKAQCTVQRFTCSTCGQAYPTKEILYNHKLTHLSNKNVRGGRTSCKVCGKIFGRKLLQYHMKIHDEDWRLCNVEKEGTDVAKDGKDDVMENSNKLAAKTENSELKNYPVVKKADGCSAVEQVFHHQDRLTNHKKSRAGKNKIEENDRKLRKNSKKAQHTVQRFICSTCGQAYPSKEILRNHELTHLSDKNVRAGRTKCKICGNTFGSRLLKYHMKIHDEQWRLGSAENEGTTNVDVKIEKDDAAQKGNKLDAKTKTLEGHNFPVLMKRSECSSTSSTAQDRMVSRDKVGACNNKIKCVICGEFFDSSLFPYHLKTHGKDCNAPISTETESQYGVTVKIEKDGMIDGKETGANASAEANETVLITGRIKCEFCEETFVKTSHLYVHMNTHFGANTAGDKSFKCSVCAKEFGLKSSLINHQKAHKSFKCLVCRDVFTNIHTLTEHMKVHNEEHMKEND